MNAVGEGSRSNERSPPPRAAADGARHAHAQLGHGRQRQRRARLERADLERRLGDHRLQGLPRHLHRQREPGEPRHRHQLDGHSSANNGTTYYYQVTAVNSVGEGSALQRALRHPGRATAPPPRHAGSTRPPPATAASRSPGATPLRTAAPRSPATRSTAAPPAAARASTPTSATARAGRDPSASNGTTYYYQVTAVNSVGEGGRSNERSATPVAPATVPGAPTLNSATAGNGSVTLAWSAPSSDGGSAITGYRVYRGDVQRRRDAAHHRSAPARATPTRTSPTGRPTTTRSPP